MTTFSKKALLDLTTSVSEYLSSTTWKVIKELKINRKKATKRGKRGGKIRTKNQNPISTIISNRVTEFEKNQAVKRANFSNLRSNLVNSKAVSSSLVFCCLNCRSANNKTLAISDFIISSNIDVCAITETWLSNQISPAMLNDLTPNGFKFLNHPRIGKKGGGLGIIYRRNLDVKLFDSKELKFKNFEYLNCTIAFKNKTFFLGVVYRPPPSKANGFSTSSFFQEWEDYLNYLMLLKQDVLLTGDINFHLDCKTSPETKHFNSTLDSLNFIQHVDTATHVGGHTLDFIATLENSSLLCNKPTVRDTFITDSVSGKSLDHFAILCNLSISFQAQKFCNVTYRNIKSINLDELNHLLYEKFQVPPIFCDIDSQVSFCSNVLLGSLDMVAPLTEKQIQLHPSFPWYSTELKKSKKLCRKLERKWKTSKLLVHKLAFKEQCTNFNKLLLKSKRDFILSSLDKCKDTKKLYQMVGKFLKPNSLKQFPNIFSPSELPNAFAKFFQDKILKIHNSMASIPQTENNFDEETEYLIGSTFDNFSPVTNDEVKSVLHCLNSTNCKLDPIPSALLKKCPSTISIITDIINNSLTFSQVPSEFKKAIVIPLLKNCNLDSNVLANYRPIFHLSFLSKVLEKVVAVQLNEHLLLNDLQDKFQSAYRTGFSTETALIKITDHILQALDCKTSTALVMIDMSSAFDTVDHNILLHRLSTCFGIKNSVLAWFQSYLYNRSQSVIVNNIESDSFQLSSGVPQGSVLAPILFTLYMKPLGHIINKFGFSYHFYADDLQIYFTFNADRDTSNVFASCLRAVEDWLSLNKLKLNNNKTQCIVFGRQVLTTSADAFGNNFSDHSILKCVKNLGVYLDCNMSMEEQIKSTVKKCNFQIRNVGKIRKYVNESNCKILVNSLIISHIDYCNALYFGLPDRLLYRLQRVQNTAARLVSCVRKSAHITPILMKLHWLPVHYRLKFKILLQMYKVVNGSSPSYLANLVSKHVPSRYLRSSDANLFVVPRTFSKFGDRRFSVCGPLLWNNLPTDIKCAETLDQFKSLLKTFFYTEAFDT